MPVPIGAGKTTLAKAALREHFGFVEFLNADELARGVSPVDPEAHALEAGRLLLERRAKLVADRRSFAQETTLSTRSHLKFAERLIGEGWRFGLVYVFLEAAQQSIERIKRRVLLGGHNIPDEDAKRRYARSLSYLPEYVQLASRADIIDNSGVSAVSAALWRNQRMTISSVPSWNKVAKNCPALMTL